MKFKIFDEITEEYAGTILNFVNNLMGQIEFGMFDKDGNEILDPEDFYENTVIQSPEDTINHKKGNSVDQANLEYWLLKENGLKPDIYYVEYTTKDNITPSHMFVIFKHNDFYNWYEHAWTEEKGLHKYKNLSECLFDIKRKFCPIQYSNTCKVYMIKELKEGTNPNKVLERKIVRINDNPTLVMLTEKELNTDNELLPTIPNNYLTELGFEDTIQERLVFYPSIQKALYRDSFLNMKNKVLTVYEPIYNSLVYSPSKYESPTSEITDELWIMKPVKVRKIGQIRVKNPVKETEPTYVYGSNNTGTMKTWDYEILNGNLVKDSINKNYNKYCVIDNNKKIYFEDTSRNKCIRYIKDNNSRKLKCILKPTYSMMTDKDIAYMFQDKGLKIVYSNDLINDCIKVSVIDNKNNSEIDSELCYDTSEARYVINCFRQQYKIRKVEKKNDTKN